MEEQEPKKDKGRVLRLNRADVTADPQSSSQVTSQGPADSVGGDKPVPGFVNPGTSEPVRETTSGGMDRKIRKKLWTPKRIISVAAIAGFVGLVLYMAIFGDHSARLNVQVERITISEVTVGPFQEFIPQRGTVMPIQTHYLDALEGGQVEEIYLEVGAMVEQGTPILRMSNPTLEQTVLSQEAQLFEQINRMENTRLSQEIQDIQRKRDLMSIELDLQKSDRDFRKLKALFEHNLSSRDEFESAKDQYEHAQKLKVFMLETVRRDSMYRVNELAALQKRAHSLQLQLDDVRRPLRNLTVRAPIDGQLSQLNAEIGKLIAKGTSIGQIDVLDAYKMRAAIDEFYITRITAGLRGTIEIDEQTFELIIRRVFPEVKEGQFEVDMDFKGDAPRSIRRGQTEQIRLELDAPEEALLLPRGGFYQTSGGNWVFVVEGDLAVRRDVRIGRQNPEYFEVLEGLAPGERVVTSSYENYEDIDKLVLQQ
ncbi:MAG: HlyD family efflux transporter periplasmic adaptor subunit [Candidatus Latescibacteria bacterium]|nr:HlyD family efflux transporter periplasmic adaptor subunit [Candidatus Latescibacterota bacterium]